MSSDNLKESLGRWGEDYALEYFRDRNWTILHQNYSTPFGECDLVLEKNGLTVFAEVKTRKSRQFGPPEAAVDREKREHLRKIARHFLSRTDESVQVRFDVLAIEFDPEDPTVRHIEGAFDAVS